MDYNKSDLKNIRYDVLSENDYLKKYPELKRYPEFAKQSGKEFNKLFRYIACSYDKNSPLHYLGSVMKRKLEAAKIAEFDTDKDGNLTPEYENILRCGDKKVNLMIIRYCRLQGDIDFTVCMTYYEALHKQQIELLDSTESDEKTKDLIANIQTLKTHIKTYEDSILQNDTSKELTREFIEQIEMESLELRPEDIARKVKDGEKI
jgi:hypothetical protein